MNDKVIVFTNEFGGLSICMPTGEMSAEQVQIKDIPSNLESYIISIDSLPHQDNDFIDAWEQTNGNVNVNINKAKEITKTRLRREREPLFSIQDVAFQKALESNSDTTAIIAEKQRLRDITLLTDSCSTLDELRSIHC